MNKPEWCHEAHFPNGISLPNDCPECHGNMEAPIRPAKEHCPSCRYPCGKENCVPDGGPCCYSCKVFYPNDYDRNIIVIKGG